MLPNWITLRIFNFTHRENFSWASMILIIIITFKCIIQGKKINFIKWQHLNAIATLFQKGQLFLRYLLKVVWILGNVIANRLKMDNDTKNTYFWSKRGRKCILILLMDLYKEMQAIPYFSNFFPKKWHFGKFWDRFSDRDTQF